MESVVHKLGLKTLELHQNFSKSSITPDCQTNLSQLGGTLVKHEILGLTALVSTT